MAKHIRVRAVAGRLMPFHVPGALVQPRGRFVGRTHGGLLRPEDPFVMKAGEAQATDVEPTPDELFPATESGELVVDCAHYRRAIEHGDLELVSEE